MKKLESTWYNMAIVLTLIAIIAGAALAYMNSLTKGPIEKIKAENEAQAIKDVLKNENVKIVKDTCINNMVLNVAEDGSVAVKAIDPENKSFGGDLTIMVGFSHEGQILGYRVLETKETPGLGAKAADWFQEGGKGNIIGKVPGVKSFCVKKDGGEVDAITASTITSRSFLNAINAAHKVAMDAGFILPPSEKAGVVLSIEDEGYDLMDGSEEYVECTPEDAKGTAAGESSDDEEAESYDGATAATQQN